MLSGPRARHLRTVQSRPPAPRSPGGVPSGSLLALRAAVCGATLALTAYATAELGRVLSPNGHTALDLAAIGLFVPCFGWTAFGALLALAGLIAVMWPGKTALPPNSGAPVAGETLGDGARTAVLIPIHNEDPTEVTAHVEVMFRALQARAAGRRFDFFLLSDTTDADVWLSEQVAWREMCDRLDAYGRVFYRRRARPEGKKAGNIRDFCLRHGRRYRYLIVLDADSVVAAETMCALVDRMQSNPRIGIIQVPPLPVRRTTLFARWQQFGARVYGPLWAAGEAVLSGPDANYYGHNAILRAEAFYGHGGLGKLPGTGPLSGLIASHDFVEAALVRRGGYEVRLAPDLGGSYEQCPTTLIDYAVRDRRWCHGNLQHLRVAMLPGLAGWSRMHLLRGALSYLIPPLWLAFASMVLLVSAHDLRAEPAYFPAGRTLFPHWPVYDFAAAKGLFLLMVGMLFGPRLVAAGWSFAGMLRGDRSWLRRAPAFVTSVMAEWILGAALAPALMFFQAMSVAAGVFGQRARWTRQRREERQVRLGEALRWHAPHVLAALGLGAASALVSSRTLAWMTPLALPLLASPLLAILTSSPKVARVAERLGLLQVPEDLSSDEMLTVFDRPAAPATPSAITALADRRAWAWHALTVVGSGLLQQLPRARRSELRQRLADGERLDDGELHACLTDVDVLLGAMAPHPDFTGGAVSIEGEQPTRDERSLECARARGGPTRASS